MLLKFPDIFNLNDNTIIIGIISSLDEFREVEVTRSAPPCDVIETRLDLIDDPFSSEVSDAIASCPLPILLTARHPEEGGTGSLDAPTRAKMLRHHLENASAIDLELRSLTELADLKDEARSRGITVIGSFHDFEKTPDPNALSDVIERAREAGVDIAKIATQLRSPADLARLISLVGKRPAIPLAVMGMGSLGKVSRLALAKCGSVLTYGYLGSANAEGQWFAPTFRDRLNEL